MQEIIKTIEEINIFLKKSLWMDFQVIEYGNSTLKIRGYIDFYEPYKIEIIFQDVFFIMSNSFWKMDTERTSLELLRGSNLKMISYKYRIEQGYAVFMMKSEDDIPQIFVSRSIDYKLNLGG